MRSCKYIFRSQSPDTVLEQILIYLWINIQLHPNFQLDLLKNIEIVTTSQGFRGKAWSFSSKRTQSK